MLSIYFTKKEWASHIFVRCPYIASLPEGGVAHKRDGGSYAFSSFSATIAIASSSRPLGSAMPGAPDISSLAF